MAIDLEQVRGIAERVAASSGLEVVEVEFRGGGKARLLRVFIDKPGGVTHEDCANLSREMGVILDVEDAVPGATYTLEVSSPGLDRKLVKPADFERFVGSRVKLMTREAIAGNRFFEGRLESFRGGRLTLELMAGKRREVQPRAAPGPWQAEAARAGDFGAAPHKQHGAGAAEAQKIEIELANVERANLVPEF